MKYARIRSFADRRSSPMSERAEIARSFTRWRTFTSANTASLICFPRRSTANSRNRRPICAEICATPGRVGLLVMSGGCSDGFPSPLTTEEIQLQVGGDRMGEAWWDRVSDLDPDLDALALEVEIIPEALQGAPLPGA